ncbi:MAG: FHA domain-containing protein [Boseongicola sp.]
MKLFSRMLSRKPDPESQVTKLDLDMDVEPLRRRDGPMADDSGEVNATASANDASAAKSDQSVEAYDEEPEEVAGAGWSENAWSEDDWDDDEDWGEDELEEADDAAETRANEDKAHLVGEIREAVVSVSHIEEDNEQPAAPRSSNTPESANWENDEQFGRRAIARSQLGSQIDDSEDRILQETATHFSDRETSRRRSAMAHLKAAAQATKADRVLKHVVGRDPAADPEEQSPYRDDLAKVVRPRSTSRPISRPVSRPRTQPASWDQGTGDDDAARFAAASEESLTPQSGADLESEEEAARQERIAKAPADLSADDFAEKDFFGDGLDGEMDEFADDPASPKADKNKNWSNRFASDEELADNAFSDDQLESSEDAFDEDDFEDDDDGPVPSSVVSDVVAQANAPEEVEPPADDDVVRKKIWEMSGDSPAAPEPAGKEPIEDAIVNVGTAVTGRAGRSAGRVKTRLLGFQAPDDSGPKDVFEAATTKSESNQSQFPVGWIVVIEGPGRGACFTMFNGVTNIGRGEDQVVRLDFGDTSISRQNHAAVAYDDEQGMFFLGHGGKSNLVRLNGSPVLSTEELETNDQIRIGETTLRFIGLCDANFTWTDETEGADSD